MALLTKSGFMKGLQCPKLLWVYANDRERMPEVAEAKQAIFDKGDRVGEQAKKLFPGGIDLPTEDFMLNIKKTEELLGERRPLFEAGVKKDNLYARVDVLVPKNNNSWDIVEVKSSTSVKEEHLDDVSFQKFVCEEAGLSIDKVFVLHVNTDYVREGDLQPKKLFTKEDVTEECRGVEKTVKKFLDIISGEEPEVEVGPHCSSPYDCPLEECWEFLPDRNVTELSRIGEKTFQLIEDNHLSIEEIPESFKLSEKQTIEKNCVEENKIRVEERQIRDFLKSIEEPVHYLDFETINPAVPLFDGTSPYQQVPFQFSLHIVEGSSTEHISFIAEPGEDPREEFIKELKSSVEDKGSIVVYHKSFESRVLNNVADYHPRFKDFVRRVKERFVDLEVPFRNHDYYNPEQRGSYSLKAVLPAVTGESYEDLEVQDGGTASVRYRELMEDSNDTEAVLNSLEEYCTLDTEGMIWIVEELKELV